MTHEEKLKAIIEAYGDTPYKNCNTEILCKCAETDPVVVGPIIAILLDTNGLKAAYGDEWYEATARILTSWHMREGNNYLSAINIAYDLLNKT